MDDATEPSEAILRLYGERSLDESDIQQHMPLLFSHARGIVLELGVRYGTSTAALLAGVVMHGGHLVSVDLLDCSQAVPEHVQWTFVQADSLAVAEILPQLPGGGIDVLFIDTDHTYGRTMAELSLWGPLTRHLILLHDTDSHPPVRQAVIDYCKINELMFWLLPGSNGLGLIQCRGAK